MMRTARGTGHSTVRSVDLGVVQFTILELGFPIAGDAHADDGGLVLTTVLRLPTTGRWDGLELEVGQTYSYGPGQAQIAHDPDGFVLRLATIGLDGLVEAACHLEVDPEPARGKRLLTSPGGVAGCDEILASFADGSLDPTHDRYLADRVIEAAIRSTCEVAPLPPRPPARRISSLGIVRAVDSLLVESQVWSVPVLTLARELCVSERRLQLAFRDVFGFGPVRYMRQRALQASHRALRAATPATTSVASVAVDHGFHHPGRFAQYYRHTFGEPPATTLRRRHDEFAPAGH